jgi:hypothetical protein
VKPNKLLILSVIATPFFLIACKEKSSHMVETPRNETVTSMRSTVVQARRETVSNSQPCQAGVSAEPLIKPGMIYTINSFSRASQNCKLCRRG